MRTLTTAEMERIAWAIQHQRDKPFGGDSSIELAIVAVMEIEKIEAGIPAAPKEGL